MKLIELQSYDSYSVIVRLDEEGNLLPTDITSTTCLTQ